VRAVASGYREPRRYPTTAPLPAILGKEVPMEYCQEDHRYDERFEGQLPHDQGGAGRHHCAGCAYDAGRAAGRERSEAVLLDLDTLPKSQAGTVRHRSPHAAWALGYLHGIHESYGLPIE
jgi:hypothetical protein